MNIENGIDVIECGLAVRNPLLAVPFGLLGMLRKMPSADIVIGSMPTHALIAAFIGKRQGVPAINYVLGNDVHFFDDKSHIKSAILLYIYKLIARVAIKGHYLITNSHQTAVWCVSEGGSRPQAIINSGFNPEYFYPSATKDPCRSVKTLVTIGRNQPSKGLADLISALNMVDQKKNQFKLIVVSQDNPDMKLANFEFEIVKPASDSELAVIYRSGDIYINSSWSEGFGLPPLEAQACGLAVISTNCGGVREYLKDGENSLIVPPREPQSMCRAVERIIQDDALKSRLIESGLNTCREFSWDRISSEFEAALERIISDFKR